MEIKENAPILYCDESLSEMLLNGRFRLDEYLEGEELKKAQEIFEKYVSMIEELEALLEEKELLEEY